MWTRDPLKKARKLISKGDRLCRRKKYTAALKAYEKALALDPQQIDLLDKLIETHELGTENWDVEDFTKQMTWTMQKQEAENPQISRVHAKLSPEFSEITQLIMRLLEAQNEDDEDTQIEKILEYGPIAVLPLIEFIRSLKQQQTAESSGD